jgi:hypothetical protein
MVLVDGVRDNDGISTRVSYGLIMNLETYAAQRRRQVCSFLPSELGRHVDGWIKQMASSKLVHTMVRYELLYRRYTYLLIHGSRHAAWAPRLRQYCCCRSPRLQAGSHSRPSSSECGHAPDVSHTAMPPAVRETPAGLGIELHC